MTATPKAVGIIKIQDMHTAFPYVWQPPVTLPMTPSDFHSQVAKVDEFYSDPELGIITQQVVLVPHDQKVSGHTPVDNNAHLLGIADVTWQNWTLTPAPDIVTQHFRDRTALGHQVIDVKNKNKASAANSVCKCETALAQNWQGFEFRFSRGMWAWHETSGEDYLYIYFTVNTGVDLDDEDGDPIYNTDFAVRIDRTSGVTVLSDSGTGAATGGAGQVFREIKSSAAESTFAGTQITGNHSRLRGTEQVTIKVKVLGDHLAVSVNPGGTRFESALVLTSGSISTGAADRDSKAPKFWNKPLITQVRLSAKGFSHLTFALHPMKWRAYSKCTTPQQQIGYTPDASTPIFYQINFPHDSDEVDSGKWYTSFFPTGGHKLRITTVPGTGLTSVPEADIEIEAPAVIGTYNGVGWANHTIALSSVAFRVDGITDFGSAAPYIIPLGFKYTAADKHPSYIKDTIAFNPARMQIQHECSVRWNNRQGINRLRQEIGVTGTGNVALSLELNWRHLVRDLTKPNYEPRFYGFCDTYVFSNAPNNQAFLDMQCVDQMQQLAEAFMHNPPNLDGMNHYYAVSLLAGFAGIDISRMGFARYIPTKPFTAVADDPSPYFLPRGTGMRPLTPVNRSVSILEMIERIQKYVGFLLYFDAQGMLRYEEWILPNPNNPKKVFRPYPDADINRENGAVVPGLALNEVSEVVTRSTTRGVRNNVAVQGVDLYNTDFFTPPITKKRVDNESISSIPGSQPRNYKGYRSSLVWMDNIFASDAYATRSVEKLYGILRQPDYEIQLSNLWMQPDLYPLDVIWWQDDCYAGTSGIPFYVMSITTEVGLVGKTKIQRCSLTGKFLDATLLNS